MMVLLFHHADKVTELRDKNVWTVLKVRRKTLQKIATIKKIQLKDGGREVRA